MHPIIKKIGKVIPVITIDNGDHAPHLGEALLAGGMQTAEITFRTKGAEAAIKAVTKKLPHLLVGAGTILTIDQVRRAVDAGAQFIVTPGFNPKVVDFCLTSDIPIIPGISNPSLIEMALERALDVVKFFPAEALGGLSFLTAIAAPYPTMRFIPTGGINQTNFLPYLAHKSVHACGGSWLVKEALITSEKFDKITELTKEAVTLLNTDLHVRHTQ